MLVVLQYYISIFSKFSKFENTLSMANKIKIILEAFFICKSAKFSF